KSLDQKGKHHFFRSGSLDLEFRASWCLLQGMMELAGTWACLRGICSCFHSNLGGAYRAVFLKDNVKSLDQKGKHHFFRSGSLDLEFGASWCLLQGMMELAETWACLRGICSCFHSNLGGAYRAVFLKDKLGTKKENIIFFAQVVSISSLGRVGVCYRA